VITAGRIRLIWLTMLTVLGASLSLPAWGQQPHKADMPLAGATSVADEPRVGERATVMAGIAVVRSDGPSLLSPWSDSDTVAFSFQQYDPGTDALRHAGPYFALTRTLGANHGAMLYIRQVVAAGPYVMKAIVAARRQFQSVSSLVGIDERPALFGTRKELPQEGPIQNPQALHYQLNPGEIVYLGDFTVEIRSRGGDLRVINFQRNDAAALASIGGSGRPMQFRNATNRAGQSVMFSGTAPVQ
jgi:hypothetical protein